MNIEWYYFKQLLIQKGMYPQYTESSDCYFLKAFDSGLLIGECVINKNLELESVEDFESNYKALSNKPLVTTSTIQSIAPIGAKTITVNGTNKKLFARNIGLQFELIEGDNELTYVMSFPWSKIVGVEIVACEALDTISMKVYDTDSGLYSGVANALLNQFSFDLNLPDGFYARMAQFDADAYAGLVVKFYYKSKSAKTIGINLITNEVKT